MQDTNGRQFGKVRVIEGENRGRFPFCNSLFIDDATRAIVDPGAGLERLSELKEKHAIDIVINTHFHFDHISCNYIFSPARILINDIEAPCFRNRREILNRLGVTGAYGSEWAEGWLGRISDPEAAQSPYSPQNRHEWWLSTARLDGTYSWGDSIDFGRTRAKVIGAPGHSAGFCCLHFPDEGAVYTGDIDLTSFGPWYFGDDGDIDLFIESALRLRDLDAGDFITGHEAGVLKRPDFLLRLEQFLEIVDKREARIIAALDKPMSIDDLADRGPFYGKKFHVDEWVRAWETIAVRKHVNRLVKKGVIRADEGLFSMA